MPISLVLLFGASLFDTLPIRADGDHHVRTWNIWGDDWVAGVEAFPTADPQQLLVLSDTSLAPGLSSGGYLSAWSPVMHQPVGQDVVGVSADGARIITGKHGYGPGAVSVLDADSGEPLLAVPSPAFSTTGMVMWPWLSAAGDAAVFTVSGGSGPVAPHGTIAPIDGIVFWEEGSAGLRVLAGVDGAVHGASDSLDVLVVRQSNGHIAAYDRIGAELLQICAPFGLSAETCRSRGVSPDGRYVAVLDEGVVPHRRGLLDLATGVEESLPPRGGGYGWVAFDQATERMLYSRVGAKGYEMVVRYLDDGREIVLDTGIGGGSYRPQGFVADHYAVMGGWATTFVDTRVISADGFDASQ